MFPLGVPTRKALRRLPLRGSKDADMSSESGRLARPTIRGRPWPSQRGQRRSRNATRIEASGSRGFTRKYKSTTVPQLSQAITSHGCLAASAVLIIGQKPATRSPERRALKYRTTNRASCSALRVVATLRPHVRKDYGDLLGLSVCRGKTGGHVWSCRLSGYDNGYQARLLFWPQPKTVYILNDLEGWPSGLRHRS